MATVSEELSISTADGTMTGFVNRPDDDEAHPTVIVIQEIFGVDDHIKDVTRRFAAEGYYAVAPDLFYRQGDGLTVPYEDRERAFGLRATTTPEGITADLNALVAHLANESGANANIGIVGYCFGGGVVYLASHAVGGVKAAAILGRGWDKADENGRRAALENGGTITEISGGVPPAREVVSRSCNCPHRIGTISTSTSSCAPLNASCSSSRYSSVRPSYSAQKKVTPVLGVSISPVASAAPALAINNAGIKIKRITGLRAI